MASNRTRIAAAVVLAALVALAARASLAQAVTPPFPTPGSSSTSSLPFPRLGMWWPDTEKQSVARIARYDWVILDDWQVETARALKRRHPDQLILNATNACELGLDPDRPASSWENTAVAQVPTSWLLTQVGSTLTSPALVGDQVLHVAETTADVSGERVSLFEPDDVLVLGNELVQVKAVSEASRTLDVKRGVIRDAQYHPAGQRTAATISFWPGSVLMDLSTNCPRVVVNPSAGAENWAEYHARNDAGLLTDPIWDGLLIDRSDGDQSWLVGNSTARSIDPGRTNGVTPDYEAFDAAWNAGLLAYEGNLRTRVGDKILFANWGAPNYALLNGNNFEGVPDSAGRGGGASWRDFMFGAPPTGSYFEWLARSRQPNLTMLETYEDDRGADPRGDGSYKNPAARKGFKPNYRKMRFGLTSALLGDGFFSYEINTNGHGSLGLLWFDEYDNAGKGRGYLGKPKAPARRIGKQLKSRSVIDDGGFDTAPALAEWDLWSDAGCAASASIDDAQAVVGTGSARINVSATTGQDWQVSLGSPDRIAVLKGDEYTLRFAARSDRERTIRVWGQEDHSPWRESFEFGTVKLGPEWRIFEIPVRAKRTEANTQIQFGLGEQTGSVWLDNVSLRRGSREVYRRDFAGGVVLCNATAQTVTVSLGTTYRRIRGKQVPSVNNGRLVRSVTIGPRDGAILLKR